MKTSNFFVFYRSDMSSDLISYNMSDGMSLMIKSPPDSVVTAYS